MRYNLRNKIFEVFFSTKVLMIVLGSAFLWVGKVDQATWLELIVAMTGLRTTQQVLAKHLESKDDK